ncbi:MAG: HAD family hydrolase [Prevotella sp.]|nr:HAD family hydrolase [Prevotella sp.]
MKRTEMNEETRPNKPMTFSSAGESQRGFAGTRGLSTLLLAFDADDTLWDNQTYFDQVEHDYCELLKPYGTAEEVSGALFQIESANMPLLGYGCKAFTLSLVENAVKYTKGQISSNDILKIVELGKSLLSHQTDPLPEVRETLLAIRRKKPYKMVVFTKGELLDQQNKLIRSGLSELFDDIVVVSDKPRQEYLKLCAMFDTDITHLVMVGNSFKSDIEPVLQLGGSAVHIPFYTTWKHEEAEEYEHYRLRRIESFDQLLHI